MKRGHITLTFLIHIHTGTTQIYTCLRGTVEMIIEGHEKTSVEEVFISYSAGKPFKLSMLNLALGNNNLIKIHKLRVDLQVL